MPAIETARINEMKDESISFENKSIRKSTVIYQFPLKQYLNSRELQVHLKSSTR